MIICWVALTVLLVSSYIAYPLILWLFPAKKIKSKQIDTGKVFLIISAYNESDSIQDKLKNSLQLECENQLVPVVISDGSNDGTVEIIKTIQKQNSNVMLIHFPERSGKNAALAKGIKMLSAEDDDILIFTDANTLLSENTVKVVTNHLKRGEGLIGGSMVYIDLNTNTAISEGIYWKYEEFLRKGESRLGRLTVVNGGIFGTLAKNFVPPEPFVPNDFDLPLNILINGGTVRFAPDIIGYEKSVKSESEELKRKMRMANRQMNCIILHGKRMDWLLWLQVLFHKIIRWFGLPIGILQYLVTLFWFLNNSDNSFLQVVMVLESLFCVFLVISFIPILNFTPFSILKHAVSVHYVAAIGAIKAIFKGEKVSIWQPASSNR